MTSNSQQCLSGAGAITEPHGALNTTQRRLDNSGETTSKQEHVLSAGLSADNFDGKTDLTATIQQNLFGRETLVTAPMGATNATVSVPHGPGTVMMPQVQDTWSTAWMPVHADAPASIEARKGWDTELHFTNPAQHRPHRFRYLIHAINTGRGGWEHHRGELERLIEQVPKATRRGLMSTSAIDQDHVITYGTGGASFGVILKTDGSPVCSTSRLDLFLWQRWSKEGISLEERTRRTEELAETIFHENGIQRPEDIINHEARSCKNWNEVNLVLRGPEDAGRVGVAGLFVVGSDNYVPNEQGLRELANRNNLPMVVLSKTSRY